MNPSIRAICFDVGGTLRTSHIKDENNLDYVKELQSYLGDLTDPHSFKLKVLAGEKKYRNWCKKSLLEMSEADMWARFLLPDFPEEFIRANAIHINRIWRSSRIKQILPDAVETIRNLAERGYKLAIISNTTSSVEAPEMLAENNLTALFSCVLLSTVEGKRKPHPSLFLDAARQMDLSPDQCAYIGDQRSRDLIGARQAGYGEMVLINVLGYQLDEFDPDDDLLVDSISEMKADFQIGKLNELLNLYPPVEVTGATKTNPLLQPDQLYDIALSTMWGVDQEIPFNQTFIEGRKMGFARFELNHKVSPELYQQWDKNHFYISTVHDPCPAIYSYEDMKNGDIQISSLDEARRIKGVDLIKQTLETAANLGAKSIVIHPGSIICERSNESQLRKLFTLGQSDTLEFKNLQQAMIAERAELIPPYLEQVLKSLQEIINFTKGSGIAIGLENRYRYHHIPLPDELGLCLDLCNEDWFGFQYDVGHAHTLDVLGLVRHQEWLERFGQRMIGVHFHDVVGVTDHQAPGTGDVDFKMISGYIPDGANKTLEIGPQANPDEITSSLDVLVKSGCITRI